MKLEKPAALLGATLILLGCNLNVPTGPTFTGFKEGSKLTGRYTFGGKAPSQTLTAYYRSAGAAATSGSTTVGTDQLGYFAFTGDIKPGDYQVLYSDGGELVASMDVNTISYYVSETLKSPPTNLSDPQVHMDLKWEVKEFSPAKDAKFGGSFKFAKPSDMGAPVDYFVTVSYLDKAKDPKDGQANPKTVCWTSSPTTGSSVTWSGKCSQTVGAVDGTAPDATASVFYRVNFVRSGTSQDFSGKKELHGRTAWIPFTL
ncbi:MAG: hypothetical protein FJZ01_21000 [Candidatus Sericytochromatia bacterium]|nr:hypothetical protein [Candidatus Tanganyikabacteria bacterium]